MALSKRSFLQSYLQNLTQALQALDLEVLEEMLELLTECRRAGRFIWVMGNGGSALTASHFAVDLGKGASYGKELRFKVSSLTDNVGVITAYGNDFEFADIFVEQLKNAAQPGDLLLAISGSGNSENIIRAVQYARDLGVTVLGLTGQSGGRLAPLCHKVFQARTDHMGRIEDLHIIVVHLLTYYFMENDPKQ